MLASQLHNAEGFEHVFIECNPSIKFMPCPRSDSGNNYMHALTRLYSVLQSLGIRG